MALLRVLSRAKIARDICYRLVAFPGRLPAGLEAIAQQVLEFLNVCEADPGSHSPALVSNLESISNYLYKWLEVFMSDLDTLVRSTLVP